MNPVKPPRKLRNFLLDKRFQLKYTLAMVAISAIISVFLGYFLYQAHRESSRVSSLDDPDLDGALASELQSEDRRVLFILCGFLGGLVLALTAVGIVATHKIAGPAYAMRRTLTAIADGKLPTVRALRKGDELQAVGEELLRMANSLRDREQHEHDDLKTALERLKSTPGPQPEVLAALEKLLAGKEQRLQQS
jgi:hypothetical protein